MACSTTRHESGWIIYSIKKKKVYLDPHCTGHSVSLAFPDPKEAPSPGLLLSSLGASLVVQLVKHLPAMRETPVQFLG